MDVSAVRRFFKALAKHAQMNEMVIPVVRILLFSKLSCVLGKTKMRACVRVFSTLMSRSHEVRVRFRMRSESLREGFMCWSSEKES